MKKNRHNAKVLAIIIGCLVVIVLGIFLKIFVVGEPIDRAQVACEFTVNDQSLELKVMAVESAVALRGWKFTQEGSILHINARKVPVSPFFDNGTYETSINLSEIENITLGGQVIWSETN